MWSPHDRCGEMCAIYGETLDFSTYVICAVSNVHTIHFCTFVLLREEKISQKLWRKGEKYQVCSVGPLCAEVG